VTKPIPQPQPESRSHTVRQDIALALRAGPATARDLSKAVGASEKQVLDHLEHLAKSLRARGGELAITPAECRGRDGQLPAECLDCGFVFSRREKPARPSRCAKCHGGRLTLPEFAIREHR
jgi:predicted Zn-ribbon and HTH transcriptional regulator